MEALFAIAIGTLTSCAVYLLLRARTFPVLLGLTLLSYAVNLFLFASGRLVVASAPLTDQGIERFPEVLDKVSRPGIDRIPRFHAYPVDHDQLLLDINALDEASRVVPLVVDLHVDVTELFRRELGQNRKVLWMHHDGLCRPLVLPRRASLEDGLRDGLHVEVELVGRSRPGGAATVDEELLEIPIAGSHIVDLGRPDAIFAFRPSADHASA